MLCQEQLPNIRYTIIKSFIQRFEDERVKWIHGGLPRPRKATPEANLHLFALAMYHLEYGIHGYVTRRSKMQGELPLTQACNGAVGC